MEFGGLTMVGRKTFTGFAQGIRVAAGVDAGNNGGYEHRTRRGGKCDCSIV